jgi:uncharacterized cupin superfamily protein
VPNEPLIITPATLDLQSQPEPPQTILSGEPASRHSKLLINRDKLTTLMLWDCTPGSFRWHYAKDETVFVVSGEAFMTAEKGEERRFAAGDVGFFPAGYTCTWRVTQTFRKVALIKENIWMPLAWCIKVGNKLLAITGMAKKSSLLLALAVSVGAMWN